MALWLVALASGTALPRRLVYVVDRRAVVDQASSEATEIADLYRRTVGGEIAISTLRGQHVDSGDWREDPSRPAIIVGTVDMIGSRLLFEGYGVSRRMRPIHAGLLGVDALVVLDEAHLVPPFEALIEAVSTAPSLAGRDGLPASRLKRMSLSATQRRLPGPGGAFRLGPDDLEHSEVARRLGATKRLTVYRDETLKAKRDEQRVDPSALAQALSDAAVEIAEGAGGPTRTVIYCDVREVAEFVHRRLEQAGRAAILFTGARRVHERERAADDLRQSGFMAGSARAEATAFLVATSAGEVGVDLDADHAVMDIVPWERMVQRLGRVNRLGLGGVAMVRVLDPGLTNSPSGASLDAVRRLLERLPPADGVQAGPGALAGLAANEQGLVGEATSPAPLRPALCRPLVEAWALTGLREHTGKPEIEPWLRGWVEDEPQTRIVWREHLPRRADPPSKSEVEAFFAHARPHLAETLETETRRVKEWLYSRAKALSESGSGPDLENLEVAFLLDSDGGLHERCTLGALVRWAGKTGDRRLKRDRDAFERGLAGRTLVVDAALGGLAPTGLLAQSEREPATAADGTELWPEVGFVIRPAAPGTKTRVRRTAS